MNYYLFPGSFCPPTYGHLKILEKAASMFPSIFVICSSNDAKTEERWFSPEECSRMWKTYNLPKNVTVTTFEDFVRARDPKSKIIMIRGIRNAADYGHEKKVMELNSREFGIDTFVYILSEPKFAGISSSKARDLAAKLDFGSLRDHVSSGIIDSLRKKILKDRWLGLCEKIGADIKVSKEAFEMLAELYSAPRRFYHILSHISHCLCELDKVKKFLENIDEVEMAIWFHDAIYNIGLSDNEGLSSNLAEKWLERMGLKKEFIKRVSGLILLTKDHNVDGNDIDAKIFLDIDLSILGMPEAEFDEYEAGIRKEYIDIPEEIFKERRAEILLGFADRKYIFSHEFFIERYDAVARKNLLRSIAKLGG